VRLDFARDYWSEFEFIVNRQNYIAPLDDFWEGGPILTVGRLYGYKSEAAISLLANKRFYDTRTVVTSAGVRLPGPALEFFQPEAQLSLRHYWDKARAWRTTTRLSYQKNDDNGSGYFDYHRYRVGQEILYRTKKWEARVQARVGYYDFPVQTVSILEPALRHKTDVLVNVGGEATIWRELKMFVDYEYEQSLSNELLDEYTANTIFAGLDWEF
jgi:hypothetical protein